MGTKPPKNYQIEKKVASNEVSNCSDSCCGISQMCDVCKGGWGELVERHYNPYFLRNISAEFRSPEKFKFYNF